jgi:hypothetical protein
MRIDIDYPDFLYLEEGRPSVFCANGSHGMWSMEGKIYSLLYTDGIIYLKGHYYEKRMNEAYPRMANTFLNFLFACQKLRCVNPLPTQSNSSPNHAPGQGGIVIRFDTDIVKILRSSPLIRHYFLAPLKPSG